MLSQEYGKRGYGKYGIFDLLSRWSLPKITAIGYKIFSLPCKCETNLIIGSHCLIPCCGRSGFKINLNIHLNIGSVGRLIPGTSQAVTNQNWNYFSFLFVKFKRSVHLVNLFDVEA